MDLHLRGLPDEALPIEVAQMVTETREVCLFAGLQIAHAELGDGLHVVPTPGAGHGGGPIVGWVELSRERFFHPPVRARYHTIREAQDRKSTRLNSSHT